MCVDVSAHSNIDDSMFMCIDIICILEDSLVSYKTNKKKINNCRIVGYLTTFKLR